MSVIMLIYNVVGILDRCVRSIVPVQRDDIGNKK